MRVRTRLLLLPADGSESGAAIHEEESCSGQDKRGGNAVDPPILRTGLPRPVSWGDDSSILGRAAEAVEHAPSVERHFADSLFPVALVAEKTVAFVGILDGGVKRTWSASDKLLIWSGNAGN